MRPVHIQVGNYLGILYNTSNFRRLPNGIDDVGWEDSHVARVELFKVFGSDLNSGARVVLVAMCLVRWSWVMPSLSFFRMTR
jgi:hypothetical protein